MITRRDFLKIGLASGVALALPKGWISSLASPTRWNDSLAFAAAGTPALTKFVDRLVHPIPKLSPDITSYPGADYYEVSMSAGSWNFHSQLGTAKTFRYDDMPYLGPTIEAQKDRPVVVKFINNLPITDAEHPLAGAIDPTVPDPDMYPGLVPGRATPHLHGGFSAPQFDGHPHSWFTADGIHGSHYDTMPGAAANEAIFQYSNQQPAAPLWYHDHAMGITRLNVYAGLAGLYLVRDDVEASLNLPSGDYEVPLVVQDKSFNPDGSLFYPTSSGVLAPYPHPIWVPEFFGDTPVINAVAYPYLDVEPRRYRLRFYNGSQARFYNLKFTTKQNINLPFWIIGMEQSLLPAPVQTTKLLLAPGERADVIIDFGGLPKGTPVTLKNDAKAPYPGGRGGDVIQVMQFKVILPLNGRDTTTPPAQLLLPGIQPLSPTSGAPMREVVMRETEDPVSGVPTEVRLNGKWFDDPVDESPQAGDTEVWQFINLTVDAHPMHLHLVRFQVYDRQSFDAVSYMIDWDAWVAAGRNPGTKPVLANYITGPAVPPPPEEMGWKDTVKSYPGQITRLIAKFDLPPLATTPADYVYHCHILEHEENEMMRPFQVV